MQGLCGEYKELIVYCLSREDGNILYGLIIDRDCIPLLPGTNLYDKE